MLTQKRFPVIPIKNKRPVIVSLTDRRGQLATDQELVSWFSNGKADSIAIAINNTEFAIDTDGECEQIFLEKLLPICSKELQEKITKSTYTKTPNGYHRTFGISSVDFPKGIRGRTYLTLDGEGHKHDEIALKGRNHYLVEYGPGYITINDIECLVTLTKEQVDELLYRLEEISPNKNKYRHERLGQPKQQKQHERNQRQSNNSTAYDLDETDIDQIFKKLLPLYQQPSRENIAFTCSGYMHKCEISKDSIIKIIQRLASHTNDEEYAKRIQAVKDTCGKSRDAVSGLNRFVEAITLVTKNGNTSEETVNSIGHIVSKARHNQGGESGFESSYDVEHDVEDDELRGINSDILHSLSPHIYSVVSSNPPVMYVAHKGKRKILRAVVKFTTEMISDNQRQEQITIKQHLLWKQQLIYAVPIKLIINDSPIDGNKTYLVTFMGRSKKPFTIGPGSISYLIQDLASKGKVLKKDEALDALTAILNRHEELGMAEIIESVTQAGYYINDKFETYEVTQILAKEPEADKVLECINLLDELSTRWKNKDFFPTVIKWAVLAPFNYIFKANDKWLRNIHGYGWASSGKTSLGKIALAVWRLHKNVLRKDYQLRFSNIDSTARFGSVISRSTYPKMINEVGGLQDKFNRSLLDLIKGAIEAPYVRGKYFEGRYQNIPSLCSMFLTSNSKPPDDSGYRSRNILIQHTKDDVHERGQKEAVEFEKWLDSKLNVLGVLGDFIARYAIVKPAKPEDSILFSEKAYEDMAKEILTEFYKSAGEDKPEWLDRVFEQRSIVEENTEWAYFEIRGFLMDHITAAYSRHIRTLYKEQDPGIVINFSTRLDFCIKNKLIPFLHSRDRNDGTDEMLITHDILRELRKNLDHIEGITTLEDLGKEIPGFDYCQRKVGPNNKNTKVLAGKRGDFVDFLEGKIGE